MEIEGLELVEWIHHGSALSLKLHDDSESHWQPIERLSPRWIPGQTSNALTNTSQRLLNGCCPPENVGDYKQGWIFQSNCVHVKWKCWETGAMGVRWFSFNPSLLFLLSPPQWVPPLHSLHREKVRPHALLLAQSSGRELHHPHTQALFL